MVFNEIEVVCFTPTHEHTTSISLNRFSNRPSRNRTYIGNLEGFCPNPLDDRPFSSYMIIVLLHKITSFSIKNGKPIFIFLYNNSKGDLRDFEQSEQTDQKEEIAMQKLKKDIIKESIRNRKNRKK